VVVLLNVLLHSALMTPKAVDFLRCIVMFPTFHLLVLSICTRTNVL
jgi:hypothetical protein